MQNLLTVKQFALKHQAFTTGSLRAMIFNAEKTGLIKAIRRIGGKVLICEAEFFAWVDEINGL